MKKIISILLITIVSLVITSCMTVAPMDTKLISDSANAIGQLKATNEQLNTIITDSESRLTSAIEKSKTMSNEIDKLAYLFKEYNKEVNNMLNELKDEREKNIKIITELESELEKYKNKQ